MNAYEDTNLSRTPSRGWKKFESGGPRGTAAAGHWRDCQTGYAAGRSGASVWRRPHLDTQLAQGLPSQRMASPQVPQTRSSAMLPTDGAASGDNSTSYRGSLPGSAQAALRSVDAAGGGRTGQPAKRYCLVGMDDWAVSQTLGLYAAKAAASSISTRPASGAAVAGAGLSGHTTAGQRPASRNPLGRRDGASLGLSDRTQLRTQGTDAGDWRHRPAFRMQYDFDADQSRAAGLYGLSGKVHRGCNDSVFATAAAAQQTDGVLDCGQPSSARLQESRAMGTKALRPPANVFSAWVQSGTESGRVSQSGRQEQRGRPSTPERPAANDTTGQIVSAWHAATACQSQKLLST